MGISARADVSPGRSAGRHGAFRLRCAVALLLGAVLQPILVNGQPLRERIAGARPGDTVMVRGGVWEGDLILNKRIALIGTGMPVIRGSGTGSTITITADSCVVAGFVIEHCGQMLVREDAGVLVRSSGNRILRNRLRDILFGVYLLRGRANTIEGNDIIGRRHIEVGQRGSGIHIYDSPWNMLAGNTVTDVRDGIYIQNAHHTHIERNVVHHVRYGLHYMYADSNVFLSNRFESNAAGAAIMYSRGIIMRHNVFAKNRAFSAFGVLLQDCQGLTADSNIIDDNAIGIFLENSRNNRITSNVIARNDLALHMFQNADGNTFTGNAFIDNLSPLVVVGKRTGSRWSEGGRGNFWSGYEGYDLDGDGVGDVPMQIQNVFQYLEGRNSAVRLFLYSPASQALAAAAAAFPVMRVTEETDPRPLMEPARITSPRIMMRTP